MQLNKSSGINVFLSYSTKEKIHAGKIKDALEDFGFNCFLAHEDIRPTQEWLNTILMNLENCEIFVPILTKNFNRSLWTGQEIGYAIAKGKHIIPLKSEINPPGFLSKVQALSYNPQKAFPLDKFLDAVNTHAPLSERIRHQIIQQFCDSQSFLSARDNALLLYLVNPLKLKELKLIMEASISNDQIYKMSTARRIVATVVKENDLKGIPQKLVDDFKKTIG